MTWLSGRLPAVLAVGLIVVAGFSMGCSDNNNSNSTTSPGTTKITIEEIIFNPKSPGPGDTLRATAVVTSSSLNVGEVVKYDWTATGGTFLETNKASVRWVAPVQSSIYSLTAQASNSANTAKLTDGVFVGKRDPFIPSRAGELFPVPGSDVLYYTSGPGLSTGGLVIRRKEGAADEAPFGETLRGTQFSVDKARTLAAHMTVEPSPRKLTIVAEDLQSVVRDTVMRDERAFPVRPNEFQWPSVSGDGQFIAFQGGLFDQLASPAQGGVDTFAVFLYHVPSRTVQRATFFGNPNSDRPRVSNCFFPSVSSDGQSLVFVSDRGGSTIWEYYALPIVGTTVTTDTIPGALLKLTDTGGQMASGTTIPPVKVQTQWHPGSAPILAVIGADAKLRLVTTTGTGAILVTAPGKVTDMRWAPNGSVLAAAITDPDGVAAIQEVSTTGETTVVTTAAAGDKVGDLAWSPDGQLLIYTITRGSNVWYEVVDFTGSTGLTKPVRISPATVPTSAAKAFGPPLQSLRPGWRADGRTAYLIFLDETTPAAYSLDLSGIGD
jgi:WD40 repeat protein